VWDSGKYLLHPSVRHRLDSVAVPAKKRPAVDQESSPNVLHYGDNLEVLRRMASELVDLIYLDPPFNSNKAYNVLFKNPAGDAAKAQIQAFDDTWTWTPEAEEQYGELVQGGLLPANVADALRAMHQILGKSDLFTYLLMMTPRLCELHRVLKPTGSLYLHCDPTASHYLKILLDAIFGPDRFLNEITWKRTTAHNDPKRFGRISDRILFYSKTKTKTFNRIGGEYSPEQIARFKYVDADGRPYKCENLTAPHFSATRTVEWRGVHPGSNRQWRFGVDKLEELWAAGRIATKDDGTPRKDGLKEYLDEMDGPPLQDIWTDIDFPPTTDERLGYQTQKPVALLERILLSSTNEGDLVLDPFCGCGTTVDAAEKTKRRWIGIDITYLAIDLITKRLRRVYGADIRPFEVKGIPVDVEGAAALFRSNPFDFERWAVSLVDGQPNEKQVGDRGIDGVVRFSMGPDDVGRALVSVKGGQQLTPAMVRDLVGTVESQRAEMGILIILGEATKGMKDAANGAGIFRYRVSGHSFPKVQILTVAELLDGKKPDMPTPFLPYVRAQRREGAQLTMAGM
jgi:DNA modification methylase